MLANLSRCCQGEGLRFVHRLIKHRELTRADDLVGSHDADGHAAQVAPLGTRYLDLQDDVGASLQVEWSGLTHLYVCSMCRHECPSRLLKNAA